MPNFGAVTFAGVVGIVQPDGASEAIDNPAQVPAALDIPGQAQVSRLQYSGWFAESQVAALFAMARAVTLDDEARTGLACRWVRMDPHEVPALDADGVTLGVWLELSVEVRPWS